MAKKKTGKKSQVKKAPAKLISVTDTINTEMIAAALSSVIQPVLLKVCRLCEAKDGPFLNIFDAEKVTAKKIEVVMPFRIVENDDLPHKICFRCSAKVEELYEFIQKCIKTQENLRKAIPTKPSVSKNKHRELWEEKLNQSNISNDDICNALIQKAMEGIKDIPFNPLPIDEEKLSFLRKPYKKIPSVTKTDGQEEVNTKMSSTEKKSEETEVASNITEFSTDKMHRRPITRTTRASIEKKIDDSNSKSAKTEKETPKQDKKVKSDTKTNGPIGSDKTLKIKPLQTTNFALEESTTTEPEISQEDPKPFDIMDHVSMIKVNGVGVLFQCKICNRNFLKKEVVMFHACAKNGAAKIEGPKAIVPPEPPKIPSTVKYITIEVNKHTINTDDKTKNVENKKPLEVGECISLDNDDDEDDKPLVKRKAKPRIGPASKVKRNDTSETSGSSNPVPPFNSNHLSIIQPILTSAVQSPTVQFPSIPSLNSHYKLMPGPNNTFTLVEEKNPLTVPITNAVTTSVTTLSSHVTNVNTAPSPTQVTPNKTKTISTVGPKSRMLAMKVQENPLLAQKTSVEANFSVERPYPVGLIKSVSNSNTTVPMNAEPVVFPTPAMKKQSYTVVQTGNPSKLLISTKTPLPTDETPRRRQKKLRYAVKDSESNKQPFSVTLEDAAPPSDPGIFTFINVDPLLQPSYVLPTDNIIQESQISTSTSIAKQSEDIDTSKYICNMCNEKFTREKKLLAHIQSHYTKMDEEDRSRADKNTKKRTRK